MTIKNNHRKYQILENRNSCTNHFKSNDLFLFIYDWFIYTDDWSGITDN